MSRKPVRYQPGDAVVVYGKWPGTVKGSHGQTDYVVQFSKHGGECVAFVATSQLAKRKVKEPKL